MAGDDYYKNPFSFLYILHTSPTEETNKLVNSNIRKHSSSQLRFIVTVFKTILISSRNNSRQYHRPSERFRRSRSIRLYRSTKSQSRRGYFYLLAAFFDFFLEATSVSFSLVESRPRSTTAFNRSLDVSNDKRPRSSFFFLDATLFLINKENYSDTRTMYLYVRR